MSAWRTIPVERLNGLLHDRPCVNGTRSQERGLRSEHGATGWPMFPHVDADVDSDNHRWSRSTSIATRRASHTREASPRATDPRECPADLTNRTRADPWFGSTKRGP